MLHETVGHAPVHVFFHLSVSVYRECFLPLAIWPQVIGATYMVVMVVCHQQRVQVFAVVETQHLFPEIGSAVDEYVLALRFNQCRTAQAFVAWICGAAYFTSAHQLWHSCGGAGAEECKFHKSRYVSCLLARDGMVSMYYWRF